MFNVSISQLINTRRKLQVQLAEYTHQNSKTSELLDQFLHEHCMTDVAEIVDTCCSPSFWAISLKSNPLLYHIVKKTVKLDFRMCGDYELFVKPSGKKNKEISTNMMFLQIWADTLAHPYLLEFLPRDLEHLVHEYLSPTIAEGMQLLEYNYGASKNSKNSKNSKVPKEISKNKRQKKN